MKDERSTPLDNLAVVLVRTKHPENIGSAARACSNMGISRLILVSPRNFDVDRALALATPAAGQVVHQALVLDSLEEALTPFNRVYGTCARTGGWRKSLLTPAQAAGEAVPLMREGGEAALVFGPEDKGLTNEETLICTRLVTIPTSRENSSLNLAQAVLVLAYEVFTESLETPFAPKGPPAERLCTHQEQETLMAALQKGLQAIGHLKPGDQDYWMLPVRRLLGRHPLRRNEFNLLMGICRQMAWAGSRAAEPPCPETPAKGGADPSDRE